MRFRPVIPVAALFAVSSAATAHAQLMATPYIGLNPAGDVDTNRPGIGASVAYYFRGFLGIELDVEQHPHFFNDKDVADLVPAQIDLNTDATIAMANVVVAPIRLPGAAIWRPYAAAGLGAIRAVFDSIGPDTDQYDTTQTNLTFNVGGGMMHSLTHLVGLRVDVRYFHALVDEDAGEGGYFEDYGFLRVSVGVTFGFPD